MWNPGQDEAELESRLPGEISITSDMQKTPPLWQKVKEEPKSLLMKVKKESEKADLKLNIQKTKIIASSPITSWQIDGETVSDFIFLGSKITADGNAAMKLKDDCSYDQHRQPFKKQRHYFANKSPSSQSYCFSSGHVWMWELDCKESWALKNWCFWTVVLEKTLESPLDCKEIKRVSTKGNQPWISTGRTDAGADAPILWPPDVKSWLRVLIKVSMQESHSWEANRITWWDLQSVSGQ